MPPPRRRARAPGLKWGQLHMAGVNALHDHPLYTDSAIPLTTTSGVHGATIAEYAVTVLLALAHHVPRMVEWQARGAWPPDEQRWPLFVPAEGRGAAPGIGGHGSIGGGAGGRAGRGGGFLVRGGGRGAPLGIVGYGSIGRELARIAKTAFAMRVLACKRDPSRRADPGYRLPGTGDPEGALPDAWLAPAGRPQLLAQSDVGGMCAPLTPPT